MHWITRRHIRVNRTATAWLIRRFIDPEATFEFLEPDDVANAERTTGGTGFDAPGARYPHKDAEGRCSFEALVDERCATNATLRRIARIVRSADFVSETGLTPEGIGLRIISHGFPLVTRDDYETMERAAFVYDSLYASLEETTS